MTGHEPTSAQTKPPPGTPAGATRDQYENVAQLLMRERGHGDFDFPRFYKELVEAGRLQLSKDEVTWLQQPAKPNRTTDVVLSFGCGVQTTPHLMMTLVGVFNALGIDFVATAGQSYCCGSPLKHYGRPDAGVRTAQTTIRRWAAWQPRVNVHQCGSCFMQFSGHIAEVEAETGRAPFEVVHITRYLLERLRDLGDAVPWRHPAPRRRALLHCEGAEVHITKQDAREAIIETLELIPGVEYVGMVADPSVGSPCGTSKGKRNLTGGEHYGTKAAPHNDITSSEYRQVQAELQAQAAAVGADVILTPHHKCHREWSKYGSDSLPVMHYTSVLAEALGLSIPDRFQILWRLGDANKILQMTRPHWESWGITEPKAREMVTRYFVPEYADAVQQCACEGNCFKTVLEPAASSNP
ncbi:(Fe-S)-binding protein [Kribbella shirazensis]|uniref:Fe-S oxidoreductase n=1 Tax=Kribbella shirazensis TaxID=1105143 RepID=A0A7X5VJU1_9ACTN|nr:(Fe-S)-binding protein [Kribbella shirazensis]NIK61418.1 Fe-S oxidoreductase [Kribbella shirazensis]